MIISICFLRPYQWPNGPAVKTDGRNMPTLIPGRACLPRLSKFSVIFSETHVITGEDPFERPPLRVLHYREPGPARPLVCPGSTCGHLILVSEPNSKPVPLFGEI